MRQGLTTSCSLLDHDQREHEEAHLAHGYGNTPGMAHSAGLSAPPPRSLVPAYPASASDAANAGHHLAVGRYPISDNQKEAAQVNGNVGIPGLPNTC